MRVFGELGDDWVLGYGSVKLGLAGPAFFPSFQSDIAPSPMISGGCWVCTFCVAHDASALVRCSMISMGCSGFAGGTQKVVNMRFFAWKKPNDFKGPVLARRLQLLGGARRGAMLRVLPRGTLPRTPWRAKARHLPREGLKPGAHKTDSPRSESKEDWRC